MVKSRRETGHLLRFVLVLFLLVATWFLLQQTNGVRFVSIKKSLTKFPHSVGNWQLTDSFQSSSEVLKLLGVNNYIQYNYISPEKRKINFYAGYYRAVGVEGEYHSPKNCIPGGGWGIDRTKTVTLNTGIEGKQNATISEMIIRRGESYQIVLYWFQNRGRIIASEYWEKVFLVWDALFMGRRDGTFVRIILSAADGDVPEAEKQAKQFAEIAMQNLVNHLPGRKL